MNQNKRISEKYDRNSKGKKGGRGKNFYKGKFPKKGNQGAATSPDETKDATNNPDHYMANPSLVDTSGRIPFTNPIGGPISYIRRSVLEKITVIDAAYKALRAFKAVAGIQVLETVPSFGLSEDSGSGINMAAQAYYTWIRKINSGSKNYDAPDIFTYFMAMSSLYSMINWCQRIYGCMRQFNIINKYLAKHLVEAMGVSYEDIAGNLLSYLSRLNLNISKIAAFAVPGNMDYFAHVASMYLDIYCDSDNIKDQLYMYNPAGFYKFEIDTSETPVHPEGYLKYYTLTTPDHLLTADEIFEYLEDMISRIMYSQDMAVMSGDTLKAYGEGGLIAIGEIPYDYKTLFKHDEAVLLQMKNATIVGGFYNFPDLYQDDEKKYLLFSPTLSRTYISAPSAAKLLQDFGVCLTKIMSVDGPDPDPKMAFEYSRLMVTGDLIQDSSNPLKYTMPLINGADIVYRLHTYRLCYDHNLQPDGIDHQYWVSSVFDIGNNAASVQTIATTLCAFKYHPLVAVVQANTNGELVFFADIFGYDNYAVVPDAQLAEMHRIALYNMLAHKAVADI